MFTEKFSADRYRRFVARQWLDALLPDEAVSKALHRRRWRISARCSSAGHSALAKLPNHRLVKIHRIYTVEDAACCLAVHKNTVRRWIKAGLPTGGRGKYPRVAAAALLGDPAQGREAPLSTRALLLFEVPGAAAAGCGHDGIHRHHADVGQPEGALPRVHRHHVSQDQRGRSGAVFSRIGGCDAAAGASAPGRDRNPPFTASVPPPVQRAPPAACRRRC